MNPGAGGRSLRRDFNFFRLQCVVSVLRLRNFLRNGHYELIKSDKRRRPFKRSSPHIVTSASPLMRLMWIILTFPKSLIYIIEMELVKIESKVMFLFVHCLTRLLDPWVHERNMYWNGDYEIWVSTGKLVWGAETLEVFISPKFRLANLLPPIANSRNVGLLVILLVGL